MVGRADAGEHEQLRAADRACREDDLRLGPGGLFAPRVPVGDAGGPAALDHESRRGGVRQDRQVLRPLRKIGVGGAAPPSVALGHLVEAHAVLLRPVEVVVSHGTAPGGRLDEVPPVFGLVAEILNGQRAARAVIDARPAGVVLRAQEVGRQLAEPPAGAAEVVAPRVVVQPVTPDVDHRVHGRTAAEHPAARPVDRPRVGALLRERHVVPVVLGAEEPVVGGRDVNLVDVIGRRACLEEKHSGAGVFGEPRGQHAARAAAAHDHVVEHASHPTGPPT